MTTNMTAPTILARYTNEEYGIESVVTKGANGYHATLRDTDADEAIQTRIYGTREVAEAYAESLVK